ncbi:ABC transporter ATP-binding protein [Patescibacteria group bacterium]|nr:ABC transporter ATP-binding protein [Patescibacteria group bacterium]MBU1890265.1 ABC transporter ATP-binding protein [Patescibacteria group bacterium]
MIELKNVTRRYLLGGEYIYALREVSFKVQDGEFLAIMGPSGSGKTTFLNIIGGLDQGISGEVLIDNELVAKLKDNQLSKYRNQKIGFIFQSFNLQPIYTALENVMMPLYFAKVSDKEKNRRSAAALKLVGLGNRLKHKPNQLSAGQRQRVSIARALVNNPSVLLADEPTGNLDSKTGGEIMTFLKKLNKEKQVTIVMVTHDEEMARYADRILKIHDGRIQKTIKT